MNNVAKIGLILMLSWVGASAWFMPTMSFGYDDRDSTNVDSDYVRDDMKEVVVDSKESKIYYDSTPSQKMHFYAAWEHCEKMNFAGRDDRRVITKQEAKSLLELSRPRITVKHAFKNVQEEIYWTSTQDRYDQSWYVDFDLGRYGAKKQTYKYRAICVRDAIK